MQSDVVVGCDHARWGDGQLISVGLYARGGTASVVGAEATWPSSVNGLVPFPATAFRHAVTLRHAKGLGATQRLPGAGRVFRRPLRTWALH